jgi:hypothetical protein
VENSIDSLTVIPFVTHAEATFLIDGTLLWERFMGGTGNDEGRSVRQTAEGGLIVGGVSGNAVYLIKTDEDGLVDE